MKILIYIFLALVVATSCVPLPNSGGNTTYYSNKELKLEDYSYEKNIQTVQLYPFSGNVNDVFAPPSVHINQQKQLLLEFDEIGNQTKQYYVKLIHCNQDWTKSILSDIQFCNDFNESLITNFIMATGTVTSYVHYKFAVPKVKLSGNYVVMVYRDGNADDVIITKRFIVYEERMPINTLLNMSTLADKRRSNHQLDFTVSYGGNVTMPQDIKAIIKQNNRWDNCKSLNPLYINPQDNLLDYRYFGGENNFDAGNEFRSFDIRSIISAGVNVKNIVREYGRADVYLMRDQSRNFPAYNQQPDINGSFVIGRKETGDGVTDGEYAQVHFEFKAKEPIEGQLFVIGSFNNWQTEKRYELKLDSASSTYKLVLPFKQGYYNYIYTLKQNNKFDEIKYEGSYYETEDMYEIIMYYRAPGTIADAIVGYQVMRSYNR